MWTASTAWSGVGGRAASSVRVAPGVVGGGWLMADSAARARPVRGDGWDDYRADSYASGGVVSRLLALRHRQGRDLGAESTEDVGDPSPMRPASTGRSWSVRCRFHLSAGVAGYARIV